METPQHVLRRFHVTKEVIRVKQFSCHPPSHPSQIKLAARAPLTTRWLIRTSNVAQRKEQTNEVIFKHFCQASFRFDMIPFEPANFKHCFTLVIFLFIFLDCSFRRDDFENRFLKNHLITMTKNVKKIYSKLNRCLRAYFSIWNCIPRPAGFPTF